MVVTHPPPFIFLVVSQQPGLSDGVAVPLAFRPFALRLVPVEPLRLEQRRLPVPPLRSPVRLELRLLTLGSATRSVGPPLLGWLADPGCQHRARLLRRPELP